MFDIYAFADYSGSVKDAEQRRRIALSVIDGEEEMAPKTRTGYTRETLVEEVKELLLKADRNEKRVIFGFDHNYSFPIGLYEALTDQQWMEWRDLVNLLADGIGNLPPVMSDARAWAKKANEVIRERFAFEVDGPFWGPTFEPRRRPVFPFGGILAERRLIEERCPRMKAVFQLGGVGSVGLQSLFGITYLHKLISFCEEKEISLHCWPFDGWFLPNKGHVLVEMYPTLFNQGPRTDQKDAEACAIWLAEQDKSGQLGKWAEPSLSLADKRRVSLEGWSFGV